MPTRVKKSWIASSLADPLIAEQMHREQGQRAGGWARHAGLQDRGVAAAYDVEVAALLRTVPDLEAAISAAHASGAPGSRPAASARSLLVTKLDDALRNGQVHTRLSLEALLAVDLRASASDERRFPHLPAQRRAGSGRDVRRGQPAGSTSKTRVRLPLVLLNTIIVLVLLAGPGVSRTLGTPLPAGNWRLVMLSAFTVWALSFMPGWLFVRFLDRRAGALWDEYVTHLHRLRIDEPANLPEPPVTSPYFTQWTNDGGVGRLRMRNLYREKFDAYYGRSVSRFGTDVDRPVKPEALFPVFLCTALLAVAWTAALYQPSTTFGSAADPTLWTALTFALMGAYVFFLQTLLRRYFQTDLRAGTYVSGYIRVVVALLVVVVVFSTLPSSTPGQAVVAIAFVVGWFPNAGMQWLLRLVARRLRGTLPSLEPAYPLNRLDGLNLWYETRLLEEGVEDLENLVTTNVVDVLLHTRVPVARLIDWVDQGLLLVHLPPEPAVVDQPGVRHKTRIHAATDSGRDHPRQVLRECGVRSATSLLRAVDKGRDPGDVHALLAHLETRGLARSRVLTLCAVLAADTRLATVYNWQSGEVPPREPLPMAPLGT